MPNTSGLTGEAYAEGYLTEAHFQENMKAATAFFDYSDEPDKDYWKGYKLGLFVLRLAYITGNPVQNNEEHERWLNEVDIDGDHSAIRKAGYNAGVSSYPSGKAARKLHEFLAPQLAAQAAGRKTSEQKIAACRENAKKPRPNAKGKAKPRSSGIQSEIDREIIL